MTGGARQWVDPTAGELSPTECRGLVRHLADTVGTRVAEWVQAQTAAGAVIDDVAQQARSASEIQNELHAYNQTRLARGVAPLTTQAREAVIALVMAHVHGLGELDPLWHHPEVENIDVNGHDRVFVTFVGDERVEWPPVADDDDELLDLIRRVARRLGHNEVDFDARHPQLDLQLPDGSRLFAVFGGKGSNGIATAPFLSIRRHRLMDAEPRQLEVMPPAAADFVVDAFRHGENLVVAGDHNAGKTTWLRSVCLAAIRADERVVTVEAGLTELGLHRTGRLHNVVPLYSRPPSAEGDGAVTVSDMIRHATRRLNPTRVIVGEILGDEVAPVLDVFSGSTRGSGCTIHSRSARDAVSRFELYGLMADPPVSVDAINHGLASAAPLVVHLKSEIDSARRYCTSIAEVTGLEGGRVAMTELWGLDSAGTLVPKHALSTPRRQRLEREGWSWQMQGWVPAAPAPAPNGYEVRR